MAKKRRSKRKRTASRRAPFFLGRLGLGAVEVAARALRNESKGQDLEEAWRNAAADVLQKAAGEDGEAADALTEAAETIRGQATPRDED